MDIPTFLMKYTYDLIPLMRYEPMDTSMRAAGTPNAAGKHESSPKHFRSSRKIGVMNVEMRDPALMAK